MKVRHARPDSQTGPLRTTTGAVSRRPSGPNLTPPWAAPIKEHAPFLDPTRTRIVPLCVSICATRARSSEPETKSRPLHGTGRRRASQEDAAQRSPSRLRRQDGPLRRLGHAGRVLRHHPPSTWPSAQRAGLFDVSHMGEIEIAGKDALAAVQRISSQRRLEAAGRPGAVLGPARRPQGTFVDDLLVYRLGARRTSCSSSTPANIDEGLRLDRRAHQAGVGDAVAVDVELPLRAHRGAGARGARASCSRSPASTSPAMKYYWFAHGEVAGVRATVSRTGYTGEDGFEIFVPPQSADKVWQALLEAGEAGGPDPVRPRRARHAAPRSRDAPPRQRHRRDDDGARSGPRLDRRLEEGRLHRRRRAARAEGRAASTRKLVGFEMVDRGIAPPRLRRLRRRRARSASSPAARRRRS